MLNQVQTVVDLQAQQDAVILEAASTLNENGAVMQVTRWSVAASKRAVLQFDISSIPQNADVIGGELCLVLAQGAGWNSTVDVHRLETAWSESSVSWGAPWISAGGDYVATASDSKVLAVFSVVGTVTCWDVTSDVQAHHADASSNHGWLAKDALDPTAGNGETQFFGASEHADKPTRPYLKVTSCL